MSLNNEFRKCIAKIYNDNSFRGSSYVEIGKSLGYEFGPSSSNPELADYIYKSIGEILTGTGLKKSEFERMRKHQIVTAFLRTSELNNKCFQVIEVLRDATRTTEEYTTDLTCWEKATILVKAHLALSRYNPLENAAMLYHKEKALAEACKTIRKKGFNVSFVDGVVLIKDEEQKRIVKAIDRKFSQLGVNAIHNILDNLKNNYDSKNGRYTFRRISESKLLPWGYLFKLSLKHLVFKKNFRCAEKIWKELVEIAVNYTTLLEFQEYSKWEFVGISGDMILKTVQKMVLGDQIYAIEQTNPDDILALITGLFGALDTKDFHLPWEISDYIAVAKSITEMAKQGTPCLFSSGSVAEKLNNTVSEDKILVILNAMSREPNGINSEFLYPFDNTNKDYNYTPLLKQNQNHFVILDLNFFSFGFYEIISSTLRSYGLEENKVGTLLEAYISELLKQSNVACLCGEEYKISKSQRTELGATREKGECDFIVETNDTIIFIELKKKILSREAQSGNVLKISLDLVKSFIDAQKQGNWHELILRKHGVIKFISGNELHLNGRQIEKLSLSMLDYSSLHDGFFLHKLMQNLVGSELRSTVNDKVTNTDLEYINKSLNVLASQYKLNEFSEYTASHNPYFNCRFYNVFHLMEILRNVSSADEFKKAIWSTRHVTTGEKDWFMEYGYIKGLIKENDQPAPRPA